MIHICLEYALKDYSEDVCQLKKESKSLNAVTLHHMEDIMGHSEHMQRYGRVDFSGQPCIKTRKTSSEGVDHVRGTATSTPEMPCHSLTTFRLSSLMSGELIIWDHSLNQRTMSTSWLLSTTFQSGSKLCHVSLPMQEALRGCSKK